MELVVVREATRRDATPGILYVDGMSYCFTIEDAIREIPNTPVEEWKVYGKTAIPSGTYEITLAFSEKFNREVPYLHNVDGFAGILIHGGNTVDDTLGCICIAKNRNMVGDAIKNSWPLITEFTMMLKSQKKKINITIVNP